MKENYKDRIEKAKQIIANADYILIGAGAGLSTAGGFEYSGEKFDKYFKDFSEKYGFKDMYAGGFYPYKTEEERWAYWSRYVYINRYLEQTPNKAYSKLFDLVKDKDYFVITTNVDHQFQIAGFDKNKLFYTQGDYGLFQCSVPCHDKTYDNKELIEKMYFEQKDGKIPSDLIPKCPVCGRNMEMNLRADDKFVQDAGWYEHAEFYQEFLDKIKDKKVVLIEIGVGYNTPAIIKYPFERMVYQNKNFNLIRINKDYPIASEEISSKTICFDEDTMKILKDLR
ncbi:MAG: Sir2 silent information regulator family NAD-dependent deacetylase [Clostridia bacterium]|nr:Sir2 silent information regulator family NAD-dependent deacetylase [Clostridia bacterium]